MKRCLSAVLAACLSVVLLIPAAAFTDASVRISTSVPGAHTVTVDCGANGAAVVFGVAYRGCSVHQAGRLGNFEVAFLPDKGYRVQRVELNDRDVTDRVDDGILTISGVNKEYVVRVWFEKEPGGHSQNNLVYAEVSNQTTARLDVLIQIQAGNTVLASKGSQLPAGASFATYFASLPDGIYNVIVTAGDVIETKMVTVANGQVQPVSFVISSLSRKTVVTIGPGAPDVAVDHLSDLFANPVLDPAKGITPSELAAENGIEIRLEVEQMSFDTAEEQQIKQQLYKAAVGSELALYLNLSIYKTIRSSDGSETTVQLTEVPTLLTIAVPVTDEMARKESLAVYRLHDHQVDRIDRTPNADGEYLEVSGNYLLLYVKKFSVYAIGVSKSIAPPSMGDAGMGWPVVLWIAAFLTAGYCQCRKRKHAK